jgi:hypothetical protein
VTTAELCDWIVHDGGMFFCPACPSDSTEPPSAGGVRQIAVVGVPWCQRLGLASRSITLSRKQKQTGVSFSSRGADGRGSPAIASAYGTENDEGGELRRFGRDLGEWKQAA